MNQRNECYIIPVDDDRTPVGTPMRVVGTRERAEAYAIAAFHRAVVVNANFENEVMR